MRTKKIYCICGRPFKEWGNNPYPVKKEGACCDICNQTKVLPARIKMIRAERDADK